MGGFSGTGVLRCAQDDGKNKQRQEQKQISFRDDNQIGNGKEQATAKTMANTGSFRLRGRIFCLGRRKTGVSVGAGIEHRGDVDGDGGLG
jgi:hypothetical protein